MDPLTDEGVIALQIALGRWTGLNVSFRTARGLALHLGEVLHAQPAPSGRELCQRFSAATAAEVERIVGANVVQLRTQGRASGWEIARASPSPNQTDSRRTGQ